MKPSDFDAKPMVLLLGQYSVGKTSFIRYIIGRDFPGARIGPEPTTDRFNAVMWGPEDRVIPGNALAVDQDMPFSSLTKFGTSFLEKFQASLCASSVLGAKRASLCVHAFCAHALLGCQIKYSSSTPLACSPARSRSSAAPTSS